MSVTHTLATLEVTPATYDEVSRLLRAAEYHHAFIGDGIIDMSLIGLVRATPTVDVMGERLREHLGKGWIGVDLDGTLAHWTGWVDYDVIGPPVPPMVERVRKWIAQGHDVRVFTARLHASGVRTSLDGRVYTCDAVVRSVQKWTFKHLGCFLPVTCVKDDQMIEFWDDRAVQVVTNTGRTLSEEHEAQRAALAGAP